MLSPTAMSGCPRKLKLTRTVDYYEEPRKLYWATRGALYHAFLEAELPDVVQETRVYKYITKGPMAPWLISGRIDYYDRLLKRIEDYKTKADKALTYLYKEDPDEQYVWQLNVYRWLLHGGHIGSKDGPQIFWPVESLQLHYLFMDRVISTGVPFVETIRQKTSPNYGKKYRNEVKGSRKAAGTNEWGYTNWQFTIKVPDVPVYSYDQVEEYLIERGPKRRRGFAEPDYMPDGVIGDPDKGWECRFCPVTRECKAYEDAKAIQSAQTDDGFQGFLG
jgi:hypothetical protein